MAYRNGTYVAFHAGGTSDPTASDIRYYRTLKMWEANSNIEFKMNDSHEKTYAVRDTSTRETLASRLKERLKNSCNFLLLVSPRTKNDTDWVPFEIEYGIDACHLPIVAAYVDYDKIMTPSELRSLWPAALRSRIDSNIARVIHIPFKKNFVDHAIRNYTVNKLPDGALTHYTLDFHNRLSKISWI